jgi:hypothetical protein
MADVKITALPVLTAADPINDAIPIVDVSDNTITASGTTKRISVNNILGASGTASLASATITGDLTVKTNVLKVNTTTNRVGINTTTPTQNLQITGSGDPLAADGCSAVKFTNTVSGRPAIVGIDDSQNFVIWNVGTEVSETIKFLTGGGSGKEQYRITHGGVFNWYDGAGGTRMTLNSTGLGLKVVPSGWISTATPLQISSFVAAWQGSNGSSNLGFACYEGGSNTYNYRTTGDAPTFYSQLTGSHRWFSAASGTAGTAITDFATAKMTLDASGNLGVGVVPSSIANVIRLEIGGALSTNLTLRSNSGNASARNWMVGANVNAFGDFVIRQGNSQGAEPNSGTDRLVIDLNGNPIFTPSSTPATLTANGQLTVNATSNTNLRFSYRGSDGTTRVANITLA